MKTIKLMLVFVLIFAVSALAQKYSLSSPSNNVEVKVSIDKKILFSVFDRKSEIISPSAISLQLLNGTVLGENPVFKNIEKRTVKNVEHPVVQVKGKDIIDSYNELKIIFKQNFSLVFRAYDNGAVYRFETEIDHDIRIKNEEITFNFAPEDTIYFPEEDSFQSHNERSYQVILLKEIEPEKFCSLPVLVSKQNGVKVLVTESDIEDYAGLWLKVNSDHKFSGIFPKYPIEEKPKNDRDIIVAKTADFIVQTKGKRTFPWRIIAIAENDGDLITNELVYLLAKPLQLDDVSWIKPGKVAWDWWNYNNIYGVDFRAGVNTETYKYFIDFASKFGIEYIILDEGWYQLGDLLKTSPNMNVKEIIDYGKEKNVGIILWVIWKTLDNQLEAAFNQFEKWGAKGIKVDFMQRTDQWMINYYYKIAKEAAKRKFLVDFHGAYKPSGLHRAYPNVITREGVKGLEHNKWSEDITPEHNVTLPFIRMVAGPMDYTPGAMVNAQKEDFRIIFKRPMSLGTRCHQLAMYVIYESPLQMLADNPSNYMKEFNCMEFLSKVPTVWDETRVLSAKVADYIALARKYNNDWYVGAMTDGNPRDMEIDFSFLDSRKYLLDIYQDGVNADRYGSDYKKVTSEITKDQKMRIHLAPGGGWVARIYNKVM